MESKPTRGCSALGKRPAKIVRKYTSPMMANCCRFCGLESTLAPTSIKMVAVPCAVGNTAASAGRSTPGIAPRTIFAVAIAAPEDGPGRDSRRRSSGAQDHLRGRHSRARVAGGYETCGLSVAYQAEPHAQRGIALCAHRLRCLLLHANHFAGIHDADRQLAPEAVQIQLRAHDFFAPHQHDLHIVEPCREDRPFDFRFGRAVGAHGVKSNNSRHAGLSIAALAGRSAYDRRKRGVPASASWWLLRPQSLRGPYSNRTSGRHDAATSVRGSWDTQTAIAPSNDRVTGAWTCAPGNGAVLDLA